ncbi:M14 family metallopeptidase [Qipengyuania qiaonensis]|uniref:Succinylglutamate desuccinylase/aspartoacylase family protein n=1 Tax=Qipengyuania qiaonensis TaxID=2867240 RepID=A0ABS7J946_9SPHN|nr:M14 family metallopeptidase [Qipengyuania qiaonensis]MBX7483827.1 succinylglutamate desuccinylase/aspartoacylase family protein [Qipengyuania qiaonensis]
MSTRLTILLTVIVSVVFASPVLAQQHDAFTIGGNAIEPGTRSDFRLAVPAQEDEPGTFIPVTVLHGSKPGPVLAAVAGVHGYEFASIIAADRLASKIDPAGLSGTLVIVRVANIPAFEAPTPYVNPVDRKNLNRSFPGSPNGTQTERIADILSREVVARADFLMDIHSGDGAEFLEAFIGIYGGPLSTDFDTALEVARGFGFPNLVRYSMNTQEQIDTRRSLNRQGVAAGVPTILVEIGQNGSREEQHVDAIVTGVENALTILGIWQRPRHNVAPALRMFEITTGVSASHSGLFTPIANDGRYVWEGDLIGTITDYSGAEVERIYAPVDGYALYGLRGPPVRAGDGVLTIGNLTEAF